jgi:hypothetical protein
VLPATTAALMDATRRPPAAQSPSSAGLDLFKVTF